MEGSEIISNNSICMRTRDGPISIWLRTIDQHAAIIAARTNSREQLLNMEDYRASIRQNQKTMTQYVIIWLWTIAQQIAGPQYDNTIPKDDDSICQQVAMDNSSACCNNSCQDKQGPT